MTKRNNEGGPGSRGPKGPTPERNRVVVTEATVQASLEIYNDVRGLLAEWNPGLQAVTVTRILSTLQPKNLEDFVDKIQTIDSQRGITREASTSTDADIKERLGKDLRFGLELIPRESREYEAWKLFLEEFDKLLKAKP